MKSDKAVIAIIIIVAVFFFVAIMARSINTFLEAVGINAKPVVVAVTFAIIVAAVKKLNRDLKKTRRETRKVLQERLENHGDPMRHIDFLTNRVVEPVREASSVVAAATPEENAEIINSVSWRWRHGRRGPEIIGAFCSKCAKELIPVKTQVNWEADLRCGGCGKSYSSMPQTDAGARPRSFSQTKKLVAQIINDRHAKRSPDFEDGA